MAKERGATIFGICNVVGSSIPRTTHGGAYTHAGPEIGVASTKAFTAQVTVLTLMAFQIARKKGTISESKLHQLLVDMENIPLKVEKALEHEPKIKEISERFKDASKFSLFR